MAMLLVQRATFLFAAAVLAQAAQPAAARWDGTLRLPGREYRLVIDLALNAQGQWIGSAILPNLGVKGAPLSEISVTDSALSFAVKGVLGDVKVRGNLTADGAFTGTFEQGGNAAPFALQKGGPPQVELPRQSTSVAKELEGDWEGDMMFIDHNVHVRLSLANQPDGRATGKLFLKGRREVNMDVAMLTQESDLLTLEAPEASLIYDGRFRGGEINGTWQQGPFEFGLVLHRAAKP
jgi:hypothetical protein